MHGHQHEHAPGERSDGRLVLAVAVNLLLTLVQIAGGLAAGSLALVADALHNLNDAAALGLALLARRIARRPADQRRTFGYRRAEIIGALINLTTLVIVGLYLVFQAIARFLSPEPVHGWIVVILAGVALCVDIVTALATHALSKQSINVKAAFVHNVSDALASVAVIAAGSLIILYQWYMADLVATLLISAYILYQSFSMLPRAIGILMQGVPPDLDIDTLAGAMAEVPGVVDVHHVHAWELDEHHRALEAHVAVDTADLAGLEQIKHAVKSLCAERFNIQHTTLELEWPEHSLGSCKRPIP